MPVELPFDTRALDGPKPRQAVRVASLPDQQEQGPRRVHTAGEGRRGGRQGRPAASLRPSAGACARDQTTPWAIIALATLRKPAMLAPFT